MSGSDSVSVSAKVSVIDTASPAIRKIQNAITSMGDAAKKIGTSFQGWANKGVFGGLAANIRNTASQVAGLGKSILKVGGSIAALAGVAGFTSITAGLQAYVSSTDDLDKASQRLGITAEMLQRLRHAASLSGVSVEGLQGSMARFQKNLAEAAAGKNKDMVGLFKRLGISLTDVKGKVRNAADVMPQIANAMMKNTNAGDRAVLGNMAFGKSWIELLPMLSTGGAELKAMMAELDRLGFLTNQQVKEAAELNDAQDRMNKALKSVSDTINAALVPALTPLVEQFTAWLVVNKDWLALNITAVIKGLADGVKAVAVELKKIDWKAVGEGLKGMYERVGGAKGVLIGFAAILGGVVLNSILGVAVAFAKLSAAMLTNPIGLAITAIAVAALLIYKYWEPISKFFIDLWKKVEEPFRQALASLDAFVAEFVPGGLLGVWDGLVAGFKLIWDGVKNIFTNIGWFHTWLSEFVPGGLLAGWVLFGNGLKLMWEGVKALFTGIGWFHTWLSTFVPGGLLAPWNLFKDGIKQTIEGIKTIFSSIGWFHDWLGQFVPGGLLAPWNLFKETIKQTFEGLKAIFDISSWFPQFIALFTPDKMMAAWNSVVGHFSKITTGLSNLFTAAWGIIGPVIDKIIGAVARVLENVGKITGIGDKIKGAASAGASAVTGAAQGVISGAKGAYGYITGQQSSVTPAPESLVSQQAMAQPVRIEGESEVRVKIDAGPGLLASAKTTDTGRQTSTVDVGRSMQPAAA